MWCTGEQRRRVVGAVVAAVASVAGVASIASVASVASVAGVASSARPLLLPAAARRPARGSPLQPSAA